MTKPDDIFYLRDMLTDIGVRLQAEQAKARRGQGEDPPNEGWMRDRIKTISARLNSIQQESSREAVPLKTVIVPEGQTKDVGPYEPKPGWPS